MIFNFWKANNLPFSCAIPWTCANVNFLWYAIFTHIANELIDCLVFYDALNNDNFMSIDYQYRPKTLILIFIKYLSALQTIRGIIELICTDEKVPTPWYYFVLLKCTLIKGLKKSKLTKQAIFFAGNSKSRSDDAVHWARWNKAFPLLVLFNLCWFEKFYLCKELSFNVKNFRRKPKTKPAENSITYYNIFFFVKTSPL